MNKEELSKFDGKDGRAAYFAYKGNVYDVTDSKLWEKGSHINRHAAGEDLTDQLAVAPHSDGAFSKFKIIGTLEEEIVDNTIDNMDKRREWYRKYHPHPVLIHFPIGLFFFTVIMQVLFLYFKFSPFEKAAYYSLSFATLASIPATISGIFSWWINYQTMLTRTFKYKLYLSILLSIMSIGTTIIRFNIPNVSIEINLLFFIYNGLLFLCALLVGLIGYYGGKITWPS